MAKDRSAGHALTDCGQNLSVQVTSVDASGISGTKQDKSVVQIPSSDVAGIDREGPDTVKTIGLIVLITASLVLHGPIAGRPRSQPVSNALGLARRQARIQ